jgi:hypothetical protein
MKRTFLSVIVLGALAVPAAAELRVVLPVPPSPADLRFQTRVFECLEVMSTGDPETREILDEVNQPAGPDHRHRHSVQQGPTAAGNDAETDGGWDRFQQPDGSPGAGVNATITMGSHLTVEGDEFCATLLHELKHAADFNDGLDHNGQPEPGEPGHGIPDVEIDASREANRFRHRQGIPQRTEYGGIPLPPDAMF